MKIENGNTFLDDLLELKKDLEKELEDNPSDTIIEKELKLLDDIIRNERSLLEMQGTIKDIPNRLSGSLLIVLGILLAVICLTFAQAKWMP